ncbi:hypothetical protein V2P41_01275 [Mesomycoplasma hyopneumoniae]|uniref:hypothetical protein n=1 Tax=Mesomycoplasma hyopneumoniae TaxID=2099 RepID=UPI00136EB471|nr:hypothetical protein [Mesomycoplasma hyopneumoniae]MXR33412.1 hypothetical protein [Mesomycoplasma hyopneumoniae]MXR34711.1 hypothetical protein [Mesomycoplasma hyopneumoniae]MXR57388.1 hypothetical protein [Mesomycoplasma hyopneumoniae]
MKNLELINLLSLGNIVVAQPYEENQKNKFKNLFTRIEDNFLSKIKDEKTKNLWIKEFGYSLDSLDSFTYKQFNYVFRARIFKNQNQKNAIFQKIREDSKIYKIFLELKQQKSRKRRSLFTEYQRLTIQDWINRIQRAIDDAKTNSTQSENNSTAYLIGGATTAAATILAIISGPAGWLGLLAAAVGGSISGWQIGTSIGMNIYKAPYYSKIADNITVQLEELKKIFRVIKSSNEKNLEVNIREKIKKIINNINELSGFIINFNDFDRNFDELIDDALGY